MKTVKERAWFFFCCFAMEGEWVEKELLDSERKEKREKKHKKEKKEKKEKKKDKKSHKKEKSSSTHERAPATLTFEKLDPLHSYMSKQHEFALWLREYRNTNLDDVPDTNSVCSLSVFAFFFFSSCLSFHCNTVASPLCCLCARLE